MKNFCIFKDYENKFSTKLSVYNEGTPIFQRFFHVNNNNKQLKDLHFTCKGQKAKDTEIANQSLSSCIKGQKVNNTELISLIVTISTKKDQKIDNTEFHAENAIKKTCISRIIKLSAKAKDVKKTSTNPQKTFFLE